MRLFIVAILSAVPALMAAPVYTITDLGSLGGSSASGYAISASGETVGMATDAWGNAKAFRAPGDSLSAFENSASAWDVNSAGQIAGVQYVNGQSFATLWDESGVILGGPGSTAMGINEAGQVTGMTSSGHVYVTGANGQGVIDIGTLSGGWWASGYDINNAGQVAGYGRSGGGFRGFVWSPGAGFVTLGTLGGANSYAMAVNDAGIAAGHAQLASGYMHAVVFSGGAILDLGTLGGTNSYAYDINSEGAVVGYSFTGSEIHAFLYKDGVMFDLNSMLEGAQGWVLEMAFGINDAGQIVGQGLRNGQAHAFRLDLKDLNPPSGGGPALSRLAGQDSAPVPEPSTLVLALAGGAALPAIRRLAGRANARRAN